MTENIPLIVIVGPTACGKTALAVELAKRLDGEVVSGDSMQIYQKMDIATAKPTFQEMEGIPHHLLDFVAPDDTSFSVADYVPLAHNCIEEIAQRGKTPILAGGTGMYISSVVENITFAEIESSPEVRSKLTALCQRKGSQYLYEQLKEIDPQLAEKLHPNNEGRVIRALEVYELTGVPMSEHQRRSRLVPGRYQVCMIGLNFRDRQKLYERINHRVDLMIEAGLLEEAREIRRIYCGTACQAIGYKELEPYFLGNESLQTCIENLKRATRRYAKRQLTWFRREKNIHWLYVDDYELPQDIVNQAQKIVHSENIL
ncbi:tRNA (adenosine(37)-N6)-dimethylallyltransferase MiaA [Youxingia wuxianensis]|uniref:tRNA dimethylallyltransferase n=1 Tax=Youxingia wuxianensis TaxID=2763678 RepID=A0A926EMC7_9FIRM|nr:tRNA (adenosine(37)-N6)-dimethylallyltransferase MiaA [Youxingia wuxianensis]MBC8584331.1 tRNA (adenosine(37)-N6)-dimethylallyltransferase MiaA [Youxingia wuxianensis]